jgi:hypothetical protein
VAETVSLALRVGTIMTLPPRFGVVNVVRKHNIEQAGHQNFLEVISISIGLDDQAHLKD